MKLNLSPSCINLYYQSPLQFYYNYIVKEKPDTETCDVYSLSGNVIHHCLEVYAHTLNRNDTIKEFHKEWNDKLLNKKLDIRGRILDKQSYEQSLHNGIDIINIIKMPLYAEEKITIKLFGDFNITGIIDLQYNDNVIDWKTNNSVDSGENFHRQGLHYAYLVYKTKGIIPRVVFYYIKINEEKSHKFTEQDMNEYEEFLNKFAKDIEIRGTDINNYELGDYENIFNNHIEKCRAEALRRGNNIKLVIKDSNIFLDNPKMDLIQQLIKEFSYEMKDAFFIKKAMLAKGVKDYQPIIRFYNVKHNCLSIGFLNRLVRWLTAHNYSTEIVDERKTLKEYDMPDKILNKKLRDYQIRAVDFVMENKITFIQIGTGAGKTTISAEVIRRNKGLTLFVVDRGILLTQTVREFKEMLGQDIGTITEGKMDVKVINVATIQTLNSLLKTKNTQLIKFLSNVSCVILDEGHCSATNSYMRLSKYLTNAKIRLGQSASYKRSDGDEMQIEACVGYPEFQIPASELIEQGHIMKPEILFFKLNKTVDNIGYTYHQFYNDNIVFNESRNLLIVKLTDRFKGKNILIIISKIEHGKLLESRIHGSVFIHGSTEQLKREEWLNEMKNGSGKVIIGTSSIVSKGLDSPELDILINATGNVSNITTIQSLGRVLRKCDEKNHAYYFDFWDSGKFFTEHTEQRINALKEQGHEIRIMEEKK